MISVLSDHVHDLRHYRVHEFSCKLDLPRSQTRMRGSSSRSNKVEKYVATSSYVIIIITIFSH